MSQLHATPPTPYDVLYCCPFSLNADRCLQSNDVPRSPPLGIGGGSEATRGNHRQDQAGVSLLAHFAGLRCNSTERDAGFVLHRDKSNDNEACREHYVGHADLPSHDRNPR